MDGSGVGVELEVQLRQCFVVGLAHDGREVWVREVVDKFVDSGGYHDGGAWRHSAAVGECRRVSND